MEAAKWTRTQTSCITSTDAARPMRIDLVFECAASELVNQT